MKILHICSYYYGTKLYKNLMDELDKNKLDFDVFAPCAYNYNYEGNENYLIKEPCYNKFDRLFFHYKYNKVLKAALMKLNINDYDLLHAHSLFSNGYIAYKIYLKYNIPYIVAVRNTDINVFFKYFIHLKKLGLDILRCAKKIVFISPAYKTFLLNKIVPKNEYDQINDKCMVIPNGINDFWLNNLNYHKRTGNNLNLVYTGRVEKNKNVITTIKCCDKILNEKYNVKLTIIGDIKNKKYNKILSKYKFINYIGRKNKEDIIKIYKNMDVFVMPSKHETFGLVYIEAMSQGLPIIYTKGQGIDKYFPDGNVGYPIKYNDINDMGNKIELILKNYDKMSLNAMNCAKDFNWEKIANIYISLYRDIYKCKERQYE